MTIAIGKSLPRLILGTLALTVAEFAIAEGQSNSPEPSPIQVLLEISNASDLVSAGEANLTIFLENPGPGALEEGVIELRWSPDPLPSEDDAVIGTNALPPVPAGTGTGLTWQVPITPAPGTVWFYTCVRGARSVSEVDRADRFSSCSEGVQIRFPDIDLVVTYVEFRPGMIVSGVPTVLRARVENLGSDPSPPTQIRYVLSRNATITSSDPMIGTLEAPPVEPGESWSQAATAEISGAVGQYWIGACVEDVPGEISQSNNCSQGYEFRIVEDRFPDLVVKRVAVRPESWPEGRIVDFHAQLENVGPMSSAATVVDFFLAEASELGMDDRPFGEADAEAISTGRTFEVDLPVDPQVTPGLYWLIACARAVDLEVETYNNCATGPQVEVTPFSFAD